MCVESSEVRRGEAEEKCVEDGRRRKGELLPIHIHFQEPGRKIARGKTGGEPIVVPDLWNSSTRPL